MSQESSTITVRKKVLQLVAQGDGHALAQVMEALPSKEIVHLIGHLSRDDQMNLFTLLAPTDAAEVIEEIPDAQAVGIIEELDAEDAAAILNEMESDDQADLIMELDDSDANAILEEMKPEEAASVRKLLSYESDTAGGMMHTEYFSFFENQSIASVTKNLRDNAEKYQHYQLKYIFVTSKDNTLKGVLLMQDLLLGQIDTPLETIKIKGVKYVNHLAKLDELIDFFQKYELPAQTPLCKLANQPSATLTNYR